MLGSGLKTKLAVILLFFGYCGFSAYGVTQVQTEFKIKDLTLDESYVRDFLNAENELQGDYGKYRFHVYYRHPDSHLLTKRQLMEQHETELESLFWVESGSLRSWFRSFRKYIATSNNPVITESDLDTAEKFGKQVHTFLQNPLYAHWRDDVVLTENNIVKYSRISVVHHYLSNKSGKNGVEANKQVWEWAVF